MDRGNQRGRHEIYIWDYSGNDSERISAHQSATTSCTDNKWFTDPYVWHCSGICHQSPDCSATSDTDAGSIATGDRLQHHSQRKKWEADDLHISYCWWRIIGSNQFQDTWSLEWILFTRGTRYPHLGYVRQCIGSFCRSLQFTFQRWWRCNAQTGQRKSEPVQTRSEVYRAILFGKGQAADAYIETSDVCGFGTCHGSGRTGRSLRECRKDCICTDTINVTLHFAART